MKAPKARWVRVKVPASSANLGPGYDVLGIALKLYNEMEIFVEKRTQAEKPPLEIEIQGEGADSLPKDARNLVWRSAKNVFELCRFPVRDCQFRLKLTQRIPLARGLGSSAAAVLAGILAARALSGKFLAEQDILQSAVRIEGHPDNLVPSLLGGLCISSYDGEKVEYLRLDVPRGLTAVLCVPDFELSTLKSRSVLPKKVPHRDAVYNVSRVSFLLGAMFARDYSYLKNAMRDRLHQDYRKKLLPGFDAVVEGGYRAGALGVALSGSGPSVFAFAPKSKAASVGREMERGFGRAGKKAASRILELSSKGSEIVWR